MAAVTAADRLGDRLWRLDLGSVNAYLVDDDVLTLVDAGTPWSANGIVAGVGAAGFDVVDVERVLVTHYDLDHVGALAKLTPDLKAPVRIAEPDLSYFVGTDAPPLGNHKGALQRVTRPLLSVPDLPVEPVEDGESVGSFRAYHTPGHTPGHVCYVSEDRDAALVGDLLRESGGRLEPSPWLLSYDTDAVGESVRTLAARAPSFSVAGPGHGDPVEERASDQVVALAREE
jgi:glyoxylase-like metal-dependent hydrolase (beta-lactamase superfamily II)